MSKVLVSDSNLAAIADAIRAKTGTTTKYKPGEMASAISNITTGGGGDTATEDGLVTRTITTYENDRVTSVGDHAFSNCARLTSVNFPNVTRIGEYALNGASSLTTAIFPKTTIIDRSAFSNCDNLVNINFPKLIYIGDFAFNGCESFTSLNFPSYYLSIDEYAFQACTNLGRINFSNLESIPRGCFNGCISLMAVIISKSSVCPLSSTNAFRSTPIEDGSGAIYVTDSLVDSYKSATNWSIYAAHIKPLSEAPAE